MKKILFVFLFIPALCFSQKDLTHEDSLYHFYLAKGDSVYADTAVAGIYYRRAFELRPWEAEVDFRLKHMHEFKYAPDEHFNKFFHDYELGRAEGKDHGYNYQAKLYKEALHEARRSNCRLLKHSWYYKKMRDHLRWRKWHRHL